MARRAGLPVRGTGTSRVRGKSIGLVSGALLTALLVPATGSAAEYMVSPGEDIQAAINMLQPGDELIMTGGMYTVNSRLSIDVRGTEAEPILVRAADGEIPHIHRPDAGQNLIDFDVAEFIEFRGIEWSGGSAGLRMSTVRNLTIRDCNIHDTGDVAVRANDSGTVYENLHIVGNNIHDTNNTGEGMYLGCNDGGCEVRNSIIERNWVHNTNGPTIEQGDGIELKEGSSGNIIRDNVIHDTNYPCILVYTTLGNGDANVIEGNAMWNCGDHGIQAAADATIQNNIILSAGADGIAMQPHQSGAPSNLIVANNTIVIPSGDAISVRGATGSVTLANNAVYTMSGNAIFLGGGAAGITVVNNVGMGGFAGGAGYVDGDLAADFDAATWAGAPPNDVFPKTGGGLVGAGDTTYVPPVDFNTLPSNDPADVGAYAYDAEGNPGWELQEGFKGFPGDVPGETDTGPDTDSGSDSDGGDTETGDPTEGGSQSGTSNGSTSNGATSDGVTASEGDGTVGAPTTATDGGDTDTAGEDGDGDDGCSCNVESAPPVSVLLLGLLGLGLRRRRG